MWTLLWRIACGILGTVGIAMLGCAAYVAGDLRPFEIRPLLAIVGSIGIAFVAFGLVGLALATVLLFRRSLSAQSPAQSIPLPLKLALVAWGITVLWIVEWTFMEEPVTVRIENEMISAAEEDAVVASAVEKAGANGSIAALTRTHPDADPKRLAIMMARIAINRPSVFANVSVGATIQKYATRYGVSPILLLHWSYIESFYGEAPSGPMPFFREMNPEAFRDLVQAHLPYWFVESPLRLALIEGPYFAFLGDSIGRKLRYAIQKADYDVSISPYMTSVYSDLFLVLREYQSEFPELFIENGGDPLARTFLRLKESVLLPPYHSPYSHPRQDSSYYDRNRNDLIAFGRAAIYRLYGDFEFATKVQALVARYYADQYAQRIGPERWGALSELQRAFLLAMLRDVYVPNIGKASSNLYLVPEFNATPINFLSEQVLGDYENVRRTDKLWKPMHAEAMWGATGLVLRVFAEVWNTMTAEAVPGIMAADTMREVVKVLARNHYEDSGV